MAKPKYKSRATRAGELASSWRSLAQRLRDLTEENDPEEVPEDIREAFKKDVVKDAVAILDDFDTSDLESLVDEMTSWRDNYPENLQGTDKYSQIDDACSVLEGIDQGGVSISSFEDIEEAADWLETQADDLEGVEFPGMFG
ncbi:MAG TPA: hypothetical protein VFK94_03350 [Patescibacteria group bacterium]|nr:hypothetical protein [Patescibacteria group bacterium]